MNEGTQLARASGSGMWDSLRSLSSPGNGFFGQFLRYLVVGGLAFVVDFGGLYLLKAHVGMQYLAAAALSFLAGTLVNYFLSLAWVFDRRRVSSPVVEFVVFFLIGGIGLVLNELGMYAFVELAGLHYMAAKAVTAAFVVIWNFLARRYSLFS